MEEATSELCNIKIDLNCIMDSCRVCMAQNLKMISLFNPEKENIVDEIQFCTGVTFKQENRLPSQICELCLGNLSVAYKFKTSCLLADETFHKLLITSSIKPEPETSDVEYEDFINYKEPLEECNEPLVNLKEEVLEGVVEKTGLKSRIRVKKETASQPVKGRPKKCPKTLKVPRRIKKYKFRKLWCEPCSVKFETRQQHDEHKKEMHKDSEEFICEICGKKFIHRGSHYSHMRSHQPPRYNCDQCDYKTWHKHDLVKHIRIHTGLKMYQCEYCTQSYYNSSNLMSHIRRQHMNERTHQCDICRRAFFDRTKLNRHLDSHLEIKRFECDVCHACFTRRCYWKKHLLRQHDIVTPPQRPGRQKMNLVIGEYTVSTQLEAIGEFYAKDAMLNKKD